MPAKNLFEKSLDKENKMWYIDNTKGDYLRRNFMNRKILALLIVLIAAISIANVSAVELNETQDFDGLFKMNVSGNDNFTNISNPNSNDYSGIAQSNAAYKNSDDSIFVFLYGAGIKDAISFLTNGDIDFQYGEGMDLVKTEGDLTVFEGNLSVLNQTSDLDVNLTSFAGNSPDSDEFSVIVAGNDADLVKEYANTIEFN